MGKQSPLIFFGMVLLSLFWARGFSDTKGYDEEGINIKCDAGDKTILFVNYDNSNEKSEIVLPVGTLIKYKLIRIKGKVIEKGEFELTHKHGAPLEPDDFFKIKRKNEMYTFKGECRAYPPNEH